MFLLCLVFFLLFLSLLNAFVVISSCLLENETKRNEVKNAVNKISNYMASQQGKKKKVDKMRGEKGKKK